MRTINLAVVHHSASGTFTRAREIERWHLARGWSSIGYHYLIEADGKLVRGRPVEIMGAHAKDHNAQSIGICVVGDNTHGGRHWEAQQIDALRALCGMLQAVRPDILILGHRDVAPGETLCPGIDVRALLDEGRDEA